MNRAETLQQEKSLSSSVIDFYGSKKYVEQEPIGLIPGEIDSTVTFTSATINTFKKYFEYPEGLPEEGVFTTQKCLRTQNLDLRYNFNENPKWGSCFHMFGLFAPYHKLDKIFPEAKQFIVENLGVQEQEIIVHQKGNHHEFDFLKNGGGNEVWKRDEISYYDWKYGEKNFSGRGITLCIPNKMDVGLSQEMGNIVVIYKDEKPLFVEWGFGLETTASRILGLPHPIFMSKVGQRYLKLEEERADEGDILLLDYANILLNLEQEGIDISSSSKNVKRSIKQLFQGLSMQLFIKEKNFDYLEELIDQPYSSLINDFKEYYDSFIGRVDRFALSCNQIIKNRSSKDFSDIKKTLQKSAEVSGLVGPQKEPIIKFILSKYVQN